MLGGERAEAAAFHVRGIDGQPQPHFGRDFERNVGQLERLVARQRGELEEHTRTSLTRLHDALDVPLVGDGIVSVDTSFGFSAICFVTHFLCGRWKMFPFNYSRKKG